MRCLNCLKMPFDKKELFVSNCNPLHHFDSDCLANLPQSFTCPLPSCGKKIKQSNLQESKIGTSIRLLKCSTHERQAVKICICDTCSQRDRAVCSLNDCHSACKGQSVTMESILRANPLSSDFVTPSLVRLATRFQNFGFELSDLSVLENYIKAERESVILMSIDQLLCKDSVFLEGKATTHGLLELEIVVSQALNGYSGQEGALAFEEWSMKDKRRPKLRVLLRENTIAELMDKIAKIKSGESVNLTRSPDGSLAVLPIDVSPKNVDGSRQAITDTSKNQKVEKSDRAVTDQSNDSIGKKDEIETQAKELASGLENKLLNMNLKEPAVQSPKPQNDNLVKPVRETTSAQASDSPRSKPASPELAVSVENFPSDTKISAVPESSEYSLDSGSNNRNSSDRARNPQVDLFEGKSKILSKNGSQRLLKLLKNVKRIIPLYANYGEDKDLGKEFHASCDEAKETLIVAKSGDFIAGGYSDQSWDGIKVYKGSSKAFLFSLNRNRIYKIEDQNFAIGCWPNLGPIFGGELISM